MGKIKVYVISILAGCVCLGTGIAIGLVFQHRNGPIETSRTADVSSDISVESKEPAVSEAATSEKPKQEKTDEKDPNAAFWVTKEQLQKEYENSGVDNELYDYGWQIDETAKEQYLSDPDSFIVYPDSGMDLWNLYALDEEMLDIARNEIYAKHGYQFTQQKYTDIFSKKNWYHPTTKNVALTEQDKQDIEMINWFKTEIRNKPVNEKRYADKGEVDFCEGYRIRANQTIMIDINGDGMQEKILADKSAENGMTLYINDQVQPIDGNCFDEEVWIVDIDPSDFYKEIVIYDMGPSSDPVDSYYYFDEGRIKCAGSVEGHLNSFSNQENNYIKNGTLYSVMRSDILDTHRYRCEYKLDDSHQLIEQPTELYKVNIPLLLKNNVTTYAKMDTSSTIGQLPKGSKIKAVQTDAKNWIQLQCEDGKKVWVFASDGYFFDTFIGLVQCD